MSWIRKRVRKWRRARVAAASPAALTAVTGVLRVAACAPGAPSESLLMRTILHAGRAWSGMDDVEIRGFLDGGVKFERNVATQYHVRIGCEASKPVEGKYEVMRVLQRWDLSRIPRIARVATARIVLVQEDITGFPHKHPLRFPVDFYAYEVKKPWNPGRGGEKGDNQSRPEKGDAWWLAAKEGELPWREAGCDFACDWSPDADRAAEPLACGRVASFSDGLVLEGPRLARHIEALLVSGRALDILIKAGDAEEARPGSVKAFFSREFGDDLGPSLRPRLEVEWRAPAVWSLERPFVLEPGHTLDVPLDGADASRGAALAACVLVEPSSPFEPDVGLLDGSRVRVSAVPNPVVAGQAVSISLLETWLPDVERPDALQVAVQFTSPSGRQVHGTARHAGGFRFACEIQPDEMGVWAYSWHAHPDRRFREQRGGGLFTVVRGEPTEHARALLAMAEGAVRDLPEGHMLVARRRKYVRLLETQREITRFLASDEGRTVQDGLRRELARIAEDMGKALPLAD